MSSAQEAEKLSEFFSNSYIYYNFFSFSVKFYLFMYLFTYFLSIWVSVCICECISQK